MCGDTARAPPGRREERGGRERETARALLVLTATARRHVASRSFPPHKKTLDFSAGLVIASPHTLSASHPFSRPSFSLAPVRRAPTPARATPSDPPPPDATPKPSSDGTFYNDDNPLPPRTEMSDEYKKKLRAEYLSFGGSPNTKMGSNYFLWIIVGISSLAVLTWLTGNLN